MLTQTSMEQGTARLCPVAIRGDRYSWRIEARKDSGDEGFLVLFDYAGRQDYCWFNVGGWGNTKSAVEQTAAGQKSKMPGEKDARVEKKCADGKYIAYFQSFTNTYAPVERMETMFRAAMEPEDSRRPETAYRPCSRNAAGSIDWRCAWKDLLCMKKSRR